jgi:hypothetical protein
MNETIHDIDIIRHPFRLEDPNILMIQDRIYNRKNLPVDLDKPLNNFIEKILVEDLGLAKEEVELELPYINKVPKPFGWWHMDLKGVKLGKFYLLKSEQKIALHWFDELEIQDKDYISHYLRVFRTFS